jgi:gluconokinase
MTRRGFVVMGSAGAGKTVIGTALADALGVPFVEGDGFHPAENVALMAAGTPLTDEHRAGWLAALASELRTARERGESIVLSCSSLKRAYRDLLRSGDAAVQFIFLHGDPALLRERLEARTGHYMPASLLDSQLAILEVPAPDERAWSFDVRDSPEQITSEIFALVRSSTLERSK